jgi:voltage-gated potassium channel
MQTETGIRREIDVQRMSLLRRIEAKMDRPLAVLGLIWLVLLILELTRGIGPFLSRLVIAIWVIFVVDFVVKVVLAPDKRAFLQRNLLTLVSLAIPALRLVRIVRVVRALRAVRAVRGLRLLRLVTSLNRGMRSLGQALRRRGFGYVLTLTLLVLAGGAAGMYALEQDPASGRAFADYGAALWWTAMILVTMGSDYWPRTGEGRLLCLLLALYGYSVFGYITATLASFFIRSDAAKDEAAKRPGAIGG